MFRFASKAEYDQCLREREALFEARWLWGQRLREATGNCGLQPGWCALCEKPTRFSYRVDPDGPIDLREELACEHCGLSARVRVVMQLLRAFATDAKSAVYATEQATLAFRWLSGAYPDSIGSEYFEDEARSRLEAHLETLFGESRVLRFEDATRLGLDDASIDAVLSCDVLEHIPDHHAALREFARVLKPGGHLVLTVPFLDADENSILRARIGPGGRIEHLVEPEFHGDPVSPEGVLAFHSFGWDLLAAVRSAGFWSAHWCLPWDPAQGIFSGLWVLHARH
ncbi:MAG: class I SAM-dependent methyltransferase [Gammaproteobacteria bacterium]|nr:class I SAM-dependent methyltransferase [Gammaproteobacteria bacterium]